MLTHTRRTALCRLTRDMMCKVDQLRLLLLLAHTAAEITQQAAATRQARRQENHYNGTAA